MDLPACLGNFLRSQRCRIKPEDVGLVRSPESRRVPGLRREEVARLAGISPDYYARVEQGRAPRVSGSVLDRLARVLMLDGAGRAHFYWLARRGAAAPAGGGLHQIASSLSTLPVVVLNRGHDVVEWNPAGQALFAWHLLSSSDGTGRPHTRAESRPNLSRMLFLDPRTRALFGEWYTEAAWNVTLLRRAAEQEPQDPGLTGLVAELTAESPEFAELWQHPAKRAAAHPDADAPTWFTHPSVGPMRLNRALLEPGDASGTWALLFSAEPGSPSQRALDAMLAKLPTDTGCGPDDAPESPCRGKLSR
ncbi:helix-turn-helix transcriptional regulator [Streptomyces hundungensis]|uniref:helix-turn-helix transcriptional regulator n=1 Tax=Streptomyces hundungensis TaxID=1077946 RepID=UPI003F541F75